MAPMFLVSGEEMVLAGLNNGITGAIPAMNYRTESALSEAIKRIKSKSDKPFGINLIVNKSNPKRNKQLEVIIKEKPAFVITSLGNPKQTIEQCHKVGIKVFCDVTNVEMAQKVESLGADAIIAVNNKAGGHCGNLSAVELIQGIKAKCTIPIISAGGVANNEEYTNTLKYGANGISIGTSFIATNECPVSNEYKNAIVKYSENDIVLTDKLSGSHLTVINTPYVQQIGTNASWVEKLLNKNKRLKKFSKMLMAARGMKNLREAAFKATYKTVWVAGPGIGKIHSIRSVKEVIESIVGNNKN
jgi:nitronate monooxygenase